MNKLLDLIKREPALVLGVICGIAIWALTRYLGYTPTAAEQVVYGFAPVVFGALTRQFVTPAKNAADSTMSSLDTFMAALHHPAIFGSVVSRLRKELPAILAEAISLNVEVAPVTTSTAVPAGNVNSSAAGAPLPPLIPPDVPAA